jgi:hypothetical protein
MVIIISTLIGLCMNFIGINPVKALVYTAVLNGVAAVPLFVSDYPNICKRTHYGRI